MIAKLRLRIKKLAAREGSRVQNGEPTSFLIVSVIARIAEILQKGIQLGKIVIEGGHLAAGDGLRVRRASGFTDGLLYRLAILISRLQHLILTYLCN